MHFSFGIFMAMLNVVLSIYERCVELMLVIEYRGCGDTAWFWLTISCILLPGLIGAGGRVYIKSTRNLDFFTLSLLSAFSH